MNIREGYTQSIPGISDVDIMPRRGFIRLGESMEERAKVAAKEGKKAHPKELQHLGRIDASEDDIKLYRQLYGEEPKAIQIVFVSNQPTENFPQEFVAWNSRGQKTCYGNSQMGFEREVELSDQAKAKLADAKDEKEREYIQSRLSPDDYDYNEKPVSCAGFDCPKYKDNKCELEGTLKFLIVGMKGLRLFWCRTGSRWTMKTIRTMHETIRSLASPNGDPDFGRIRGIPLLLTREKKQYTLPTGIKTTKWVLSLDVADVGISDLLALAEPGTIMEKAKEARALLGSETVDVEGPENVISKEDKAEAEPEPEKVEKKDPGVFDPEVHKEDFVGLEKAAQIEVLESMMKQKAYDKSQLKKPLDKFTKQYLEMFWDTVHGMEDPQSEDVEDDIPF